MAQKSSLNMPLMLGALLVSSPAAVGATDFDEMEKCSQARVKALKVITVGQASLYRDDCGAEDMLAPPLRLAFGYNREVPGDAFAKAARKMIQRNVDEPTYDALEERINRFNSVYRTTGDGDTYTLDYGDDQTLVLKLNGETLNREEGERFARAYLSIWFGDEPYSDALKQDLLER